MKNRINLILTSALSLSLILLSGCATSPVTSGGYEKAQWATKAMIRDLKENKTQTLNIDILAIKNQKARFEISAMLGYQVGSLVMNQQDIAFIIYPKKVFYYGRNSERALSQLLDLPLHPMNLTYIAFDEPVRGQGWQCLKGLDGFLISCENPARKLLIKWIERKEGTKKVVITAPQFEMQWYFENPQTEVQFKNEIFTLKQPEGFKAIQLN
jgi:hypothetical protein